MDNSAQLNLLWNFQRDGLRHVYLVVGDEDAGTALRRFEDDTKISATLVTVHPQTPQARIDLAVADHDCCVFYLRSNIPGTMRHLRCLLEQHKYSTELLECINKVYHIDNSRYRYALAA